MKTSGTYSKRKLLEHILNENFWKIFSTKTSETYSQRKPLEHILNENFWNIFSKKTSGTYSRMNTSGSYLLK